MFDCLWAPIHGQFWLGRKIRFYISKTANQLCHFIVPNDEQTGHNELRVAIARRPETARTGTTAPQRSTVARGKATCRRAVVRSIRSVGSLGRGPADIFIHVVDWIQQHHIADIRIDVQGGAHKFRLRVSLRLD